MKYFLPLVAILFMMAVVTPTHAQIKSVKKETKRQGTRRVNNKIDQGIDKGFDKIEEGIGSLFGKKKKKKNKGNISNETASSSNSSSTSSGGNNSVAGLDPEALFQEHGMYPPDGATDVPIPVILKWTPMNGDGFKADGYELYLEEGNTNPMKMLGGTRGNKKECKNLKPNTTYSWSFKGEDSNGRYMPGGGGTFTTGGTVAPQNNVQWNRFDFVPGDEVIFSDGPDIMEENGEFPSRWDLVQGGCEIINVNGENVIAFPKGGSIIPYLKNSKDDYLPEVFTVELDAWFYTDTNQRDLYIYFFDKKNQSNDLYQSVEVNSFSAEFGNSYQAVKRDKHNGMWRHISIAYTKGKLKVYLDETRLINIPRMEGNPTGLTFNFSGYSGDNPDELQYIKNVRIAKGGVKYYDRVLSDGKIICNGIRFDVNKATLKPESMGPINKIYELMTKKPDLKFSVEGHTDADGDDAKNQTLSEQRAKTVMNKLIAMGISSDRLTSKGFGEGKPLDNNNTPEGKANNRRVEFVKF